MVENFTPGVAAKMGIDYETLHRLNAGLIHCSISGFGQYGPHRTRMAFDPIIQGMTGRMSITGKRTGRPSRWAFPSPISSRLSIVQNPDSGFSFRGVATRSCAGM